MNIHTPFNVRGMYVLQLMLILIKIQKAEFQDNFYK